MMKKARLNAAGPFDFLVCLLGLLLELEINILRQISIRQTGFLRQNGDFLRKERFVVSQANPESGKISALFGLLRKSFLLNSAYAHLLLAKARAGRPLLRFAAMSHNSVFRDLSKNQERCLGKIRLTSKARFCLKAPYYAQKEAQNRQFSRSFLFREWLCKFLQFHLIPQQFLTLSQDLSKTIPQALLNLVLIMHFVTL